MGFGNTIVRFILYSKYVTLVTFREDHSFRFHLGTARKREMRIGNGKEAAIPRRLANVDVKVLEQARPWQ
jgi:hypothetical protein